jgi:hypothetical protein
VPELTPLKSALAACRKMQSMNSNVRSLACGIRSLKDFSQIEDHLNAMSKTLEEHLEDQRGNGEGSWGSRNDRGTKELFFFYGCQINGRGEGPTIKDVKTDNIHE